jgi:DNA polymerase I-like protein with 3'-5' exonuclease and polymerase domains
MAEVYSSLPEEVKLVGSVHDELVLEAPETMAREMASKLRRIMVDVGSELLRPVPSARIEPSHVTYLWGTSGSFKSSNP